ncbi:adenine phosphoribosyltransferase [Psychroflexus maritimus]|uniref:Adenine phosphoribosyltransferase n=1 Tax=Psychroflexus maritimus TaxID=2714865 RepID=A0A967E1N5_9FLAO|nr:adenine phosphoribosyltransferase [Psychroflexus maritimus]NGZ88969.1 adenine phosphoribosyltransferase [Psychroflexus maritimus]
MKEIQHYIREINDFPKKGVVYKDISPLLGNIEAMRLAVDKLIANLPHQNIDKVVGIESRGFFLATLLADRLNAGFVPIRKPGKLPYKTYQQKYDLEYGHDQLEIHQDAIQMGEKVLIHDDVLATGGTAEAAVKLVNRFDAAIVQLNFIIEIPFLNGREKIKKQQVFVLQD